MLRESGREGEPGGGGGLLLGVGVHGAVDLLVDDLVDDVVLELRLARAFCPQKGLAKSWSHTFEMYPR